MEKIGGIRTKTAVPRLLMNLGCRKRYQRNAVAMYYYSEIDIRIIGFVFSCILIKFLKTGQKKMEKNKGINVKNGLYLCNPKPYSAE